MANESRFSKVDEALWAALQDSGTADGLELANWRAAQSSGTGAGKDFDSG